MLSLCMKTYFRQQIYFIISKALQLFAELNVRMIFSPLLIRIPNAQSTMSVIRHINFALADRRAPLTGEAIFMLLAAANFLGNTAIPSASYGPSLLAHGVGALTSAVCALNTVIATHSVGPPLLENLLSLLGQRCLSHPGYPCVTEGLQAGLLRAIVLSSMTKLTLSTGI